LRGSSRSRTATADLDPDGKVAVAGAVEAARTRSEDAEVIQENEEDGTAQHVDEVDEDGVEGQEGGETQDTETETETEVQDGTVEDDDIPAAEGSAEGLDKGKGKMTMEERMAKLKDLRVRMVRELVSSIPPRICVRSDDTDSILVTRRAIANAYTLAVPIHRREP
jgi:hypothetical protein